MPSDPACDRCHSVKTRCLAGPGASCYRCYRLHYPCTHSRRRGRRGPKPRVTSRHRSLPSTPDMPDNSPSTASNQEHTDHESDTSTNVTLITTMYHENSLSRISDYMSLQICAFFSFGPLLGIEMRQMIQSRLREAPILLLHPYTTVARAFLRSTTHQAPCSDSDWSNCASALQVLRNAQIIKKDHVGSFLSLGLSLLTFHRLISGFSASTICRYTLSLVRPLYYSGELVNSDTRELLCLIFLDTTQSLFRAEVPVIEYQVRDPYIVDHHAGLCGPLLPLLYQVCVLGSATRTRNGNSSLSSDNFDKLMAELEAWVPNISQSVLDRFSNEEMLVLISQAKIHRTAAILILHRLQYPFGERDAEAVSFATSIVADITHCLETAGYHPPNITLAILVAGAEIANVAGRNSVLSLVSRIRGAAFYPFVANLRMFLARVWADRDQGTARYLFRIFEDRPSLSVPL